MKPKKSKSKTKRPRNESQIIKDALARQEANYNQKILDKKRDSIITHLTSDSNNLVDTRNIHGFDKIWSEHITLYGRVFWISVLLISCAGLLWTIQKRIKAYNQAIVDTSYSSTIKTVDSNGLSFPSVSICSEGFNTEFATFDLMKTLEDRIGYYYDNPNYLLQRIMNKEANSFYRVVQDRSQSFSKFLTLKQNKKF